MRRRHFIRLLSTGAISWSYTALAQQPNRVRRLSVLVGLGEDDAGMKPRLLALREELALVGWIEGVNIRTEYRYAPGGVGAAEQAKAVVATQPDVILAHTVSVTTALQAETKTLPIVFVSVGDPFGSGIVASLARPGANLTGLMTFEAGVGGKWLSMLKEVVPGLSRAIIVANANVETYGYYRQGVEAAAPALSVEVLATRMESYQDIERSVEAFSGDSRGGLVVAPDLTTASNGNLIIALAARHRLPAVYAFSYLVSAGGLMSYGTNRVAEMRDAASYIDRILRGALPGELPVQTPTRFETAVNLKTAGALGLTIPPTLLARADEVID